MRYLIIILLLLAAIPACDYDLIPTARPIEIGNIYDYDFEGSEEIPEFETIEDAIQWVAFNSIFNYDNILYGKDDYYATPEEFYYNRNSENKMQGDCEDYAIFLGYLLYMKMGYKDVQIIRLNTSNPFINHIILYVDNHYIEPQMGMFFVDKESLEKQIIKRFPYSKFLWIAVNYHGIL
jgi:hypothetical protein